MSSVFTSKRKKRKYGAKLFITRQTKQIVAFQMGDRSAKTCKKFWRKLQELGLQGKLHTDLWKADANIFPAEQYVPHEKKRKHQSY